MELQRFLDNCQKRFGYKFKNAEYLRTALTHSSGADTPQASNERMEFLGDSVLGYVICEHLFHAHPNMLEGDMTKIKSAVVSRTSCQKVAKQIGMDECLILGRGLSRSSRIPLSILANTMESLIAAIYLDGGIEPAREFVLRVFREEIDKMLLDHDGDNYKSVLQHISQKRFGQTPEYVLLEIKGPEHYKSFHVQVRIGKKNYPAAWGITKKEAEQHAAENAFYVMNGERPPYREPGP